MMTTTFINGMDISFLDEIEQGGGAYYSGAEESVEKPEDLLYILKDNGVNAIRLRIWNDPPGGFCNLERTLIMAKRIKEAGLNFLLDFHYSDKWADPANQSKPKAWENLDFTGLTSAVYEYTREVLELLQSQGTMPDMVQIGNEITPGMLWNEGKVDGEWDTTEQWEQFITLVQAGIAGAKAVASDLSIMIHIDRGADHPASRNFYDRFFEHGVNFDVIGLSFYSWWHGTLDDLRSNLNELTVRYNKDIIVVETAYPWTLNAPEGFPLIVSEEKQLHEGYPATVEGQTKYMKDFISVIENIPNGKGIGFYYWEPAWVPSQKEWSVGHENGWSNLTLFDFAGGKLDSLEF
ncbi:glycoside hydrolase family 53 protein [Paenibacillus odorifer]|uniref:glycoside hydrolase family 53 protein n=1 Tax=Paenibacillus odorifer TaxID=189426 RepID=UPI00273D936A|nr:arabinogalactan endo-1,4-beta-galactosidase [Paenibacillus odorifer]